MKRVLVILCLCLGVSSMLFSQTLEMEKLRKNREQTLKELNETNKKLNRTLRNAKSSLNELNSITAEIRQQRNLIAKINREITAINRRQRSVKDTIYLLQKDLTAKKRSYAKAVKRMGHRRSEYDELMFIFSASSLSQSYRRARYLKEYSAWRKRQAEEIAERKAVDAAERDLASDLMAEIDQTAKGITAPCKVVASRNLRIDDSDVRLYQKQMESVADYSKRMKKRMNDALRDMQDGGIKHHRQMGRIVEARYAYRPDQRYYASKKMPDNWPTMAISVLVDLSGSMHGERLDAAMKATMLLHDFATGLGIPIFIAGHNATGDRVNYNVMAEFNGVDTRDKYRLAHMYLGGDNYDGIAIDLSGSLLAKRSEDVKLLFIISDGQPNHEGYRGDVAKKDIQEIVTKYRRKGIITFATAIGSDRDKIRAIYGDGYLDISDLSEFPKQLTRMVAKRILRN